MLSPPQHVRPGWHEYKHSFNSKDKSKAHKDINLNIPDYLFYKETEQCLQKSMYLRLWYSYEHSQYVIWGVYNADSGTTTIISLVQKLIKLWLFEVYYFLSRLRSQNPKLLEKLDLTFNAFISAPMRAITVHNTSYETSVYADCGTVNIFSLWSIFSEQLTFKDKHFLPKPLYMWSHKTAQSSARIAESLNL